MEQNTDQKRVQLIEALAGSLLSKRNEALGFRSASGVERRWREDENTFDGLDSDGSRRMIDYATGEASIRDSQEPKRSRVIVNVVRGKCETAEGRFSDIQLPVDDRNWGLKVTPDPKITDGMKDRRQAAQEGQPLSLSGGQPIRISDIAKSDLDRAKEKMKDMETEIDDQLTECRFNGECRKVIKNAIRLGTGILKGPTILKQFKRAWIPRTEGETTIHEIKTEEEFKPASKSVDPWNVFPDPECEEDITRAAYIWERDEILPRELRKLIGVEGYLADQIYQILDEEPKRTTVYVAKSGRQETKQTITNKGSSYERWEYYGDLNKDDMESLGCDCSETSGETVSACAVFVNDRPIKVMLNTLDTGEIPYDFFQWTSVNGSPWGVGIPRIALWPQRTLTAAWRGMMDNAGDSSGANIVLGPGIEPDDGRWEITGKKIWRATGETEDVRAAFAQFQPLSYQNELQSIIELSLQFLDMETSLPLLFQGEKGTLPETLGATNIMVDASNVALRARVKIWDDQITRPHVTRYYNWNMQYNEKSKIKGDYNVDVRGTSILLEKDQRARSLFQVLSAKQDPDIAQLVDWEKVTKQLFASMRLDILKTDDEVKRDREQQAPPADPRIAAAQIRAQTEMEKAKIVHHDAIEEIRLKREAMIAELQEKARIAEIEMQHKMDMKAIDFQMAQMDYASREGISLDKIKADLATNAAKLNLQERLSLNKAGEAIKPPVEPPGRSPEGESFVK
jgi:hypothetical protein